MSTPNQQCWEDIARLEGHSASRGHKPAAHLYLTFETPTGCSEGTGEEGGEGASLSTSRKEWSVKCCP